MAIKYWERRRLIYNLVLIPPTLLGYLGASVLSAAVGDRPYFGIAMLGLLLGLSAIAANICYSFCYALEFLFSDDKPGSGWLEYGRTLAFVSGTLFAVMLAAVGGHNIAIMQYSGF